MDENLKKLWNNNKVLFFLLIPIILIVVFKNVLIDLLAKDSRRIMKEAENTNNSLSKDIVEANTKANDLIENAKKLSENKEKVDENWNKND